MADKIKVYYINANGVYQGHFRLEDPGYVAKAGETTVPKPSLREPAVLQGGAWRGATDEEYAAWLQAHPQKEVEPAQPSVQDKAIPALGQQVGTLTVANQQTAQIAKQAADAASTLGQQVATMIAKSNENGGK